MTAQQRYDEQKRIQRDVTTSQDEALKRLALFSAFRGTLTEWRELLRTRNPLFGPQMGGKFKGASYGLEIDLTGRGRWEEAGLYGTKAEAEKEGRAIHKRDGFPYRVKATRDTRNPTDRAKRYRAQRNAPPGRKICNFCASRENIDIDHITGDESDGDVENLMYLCRPCNTTKGIVQARNHIGIRTRQYNPLKVPTLAQFKEHARTLLGIGTGDAAEATAAIRATPAATRARYAEKIEAANPFRSEAQRRKFFAMVGRGEMSMATLKKFERGNPAAPTFKQYLAALHHHQRHAHDEGGRTIHATPKYKRSEYASKIARFKSKRRAADAVPF